MRNKFTAVRIWLFPTPLAFDFKALEDATSHLTQILRYGHKYRYSPGVLTDLHVQRIPKDFVAMPPVLPGRAQP